MLQLVSEFFQLHGSFFEICTGRDSPAKTLRNGHVSLGSEANYRSGTAQKTRRLVLSCVFSENGGFIMDWQVLKV